MVGRQTSAATVGLRVRIVGAPAPDLHSTVWNDAEQRDLVLVRDGGRPREPTRVAMVRSHGRLLVRFDCVASTITATMTRQQDLVWHEDVVEVFLWPPGEACVYEMQVSPHCVRRTVRVSAHGTREQSFDDSWLGGDLDTRTSVSYHDGRVTGWQALLAIPAALVAGNGPVAGPPRLGLFRINRRPVEEFSALLAGSSGTPNFHDNSLLLPLHEERRELD